MKVRLQKQLIFSKLIQKVIAKKKSFDPNQKIVTFSTLNFLKQIPAFTDLQHKPCTLV